MPCGVSISQLHHARLRNDVRPSAVEIGLARLKSGGRAGQLQDRLGIHGRHLQGAPSCWGLFDQPREVGGKLWIDLDVVLHDEGQRRGALTQRQVDGSKVREAAGHLRVQQLAPGVMRRAGIRAGVDERRLYEDACVGLEGLNLLRSHCRNAGHLQSERGRFGFAQLSEHLLHGFAALSGSVEVDPIDLQCPRHSIGSQVFRLGMNVQIRQRPLLRRVDVRAAVMTALAGRGLVGGGQVRNVGLADGTSVGVLVG
mmetsp:Transcript_21144/g.49200  ORF Transcript_21144/g.49200 Transcript_21144/m.49200 type:complete len:255 (+) Transcript_21144:1461-2225(+)